MILRFEIKASKIIKIKPKAAVVEIKDPTLATIFQALKASG